MSMMNYGYGDESLGKSVMIESDKRMNQALRRIGSFETWSWEDFFDYVMVGIRWQPELARSLYAAGRKAMDRGHPTPARAFKNAEIELRIGTTNTFDFVDHAGGLTGVGSLNFEPDEGMRAFRIYNPTILTANFHGSGNIGRINGELGTGKTNTGCVILEQWVKENPNHIAIANIRMLKPDARILYAPDLSTFIKILSELPEDAVVLFVLDEGGLTYNKPDQATRRVKDLDKLMRIIRKLHMSFILIEQREISVPNLIMEWARNIYVCKAKGVVSMELRGPELAFRDTVKGFPKATLPFDTDDPAMFEIDIDIMKLLWAITNQDDRKAAMKDFLATDSAYIGNKTVPVCREPGCTKPRGQGNKLYCDDHKRTYIMGYGTVTVDAVRKLEEQKRVNAEEKRVDEEIKSRKPRSLSEFLE